MFRVFDYIIESCNKKNQSLKFTHEINKSTLLNSMKKIQNDNLMSFLI